MLEDFDCDCTEEFGPCEQHSELFVSREGASLRTADELLTVFLNDAKDLGAELSPYGQDVLTRADAALMEYAKENVSFSAWLDDAELQDELATVVSQLETELYTLGYSIYWEDGYRIVKITGGPFKEDGE